MTATNANSGLFRRALSLALALVMVLGMFPVGALAADGDVILYLKPSSNWLESSPRFAIYYYDGQGGDGWSGMSDADGDGVWEGTVPAGNPNVIFCRMNPGAAENNWDNKWNQTSDLVIPTDGTNCYTVAEGAWDKGAGSWSQYPAQGGETPEPEAVYTVAGSEELCGTPWDPANMDNAMIFNQATGLYEKVYDKVAPGEYELKVTDGTWFNCWGTGPVQNYFLTVTEPSKVTVTFDGAGTVSAAAVGMTYIVAGSAELCGTGWDPAAAANKMAYNGETGLYEKTYENVPAGNYELKVTDGSWANSWGNGVNNIQLVLDVLSNVTVTFDGVDTVAVTSLPVETTPDPTPEPEKDYFVVGDSGLCGSHWEVNDAANKMSRNPDTGLYEKVYPAVQPGTYGLKVTNGTWDDGGNWGDNGQNYVFKVSESCDVTVTFNDAKGTVTVTGDYAAKVVELEVSSIHAVGNGAGTWLNGIAWDPSQNAMEEVADKVYEITFRNVPQGASYEVKFAANGNWTDSWGGAYTESGAAADAYYNGGNIQVPVTFAAADVKLQLDLTNYNHGDKTGAKFTITVTEVEAAPVEYTYTVHYANPDGWETVNGYAWLGEEKLLGDWPGTALAANADNATWSDAVVTCTSSVLSIIFNGGDGQTENLTVTAPEGETEVEAWVTGKTAADVAYTAPETWVDPPQVTLHYYNENSWTGMNVYLWLDGDMAIPGYEGYKSWPGKAVSENTDHTGWYDMVVTTDHAAGFNFIFNGSGGQTSDMATGPVSGDTELWILGGQVMDYAPGEWSGEFKYDLTIHFETPADWETVNMKLGQGSSWNAIPGYEQYTQNEFGAAMTANPSIPGWHDATVLATETEVNGLFNNGSWGGSNQTPNWTVSGLVSGKNEYWYYDGGMHTEPNANWIDPNRTIHVPGTFPGPSWDAASNQMTYDPSLGLYVYTFENVPAANYEYKISVNGSWTENYGPNGEPNSSGNIAVSVPETMDVTVYYNDRSHRSVTSVTYVFAQIGLSGTGIPQGTKLSDPDLTGIYSALVSLEAGKYEDLKLSFEDQEFSFSAFELAEGKDVTFYFDPATGIYYHDGSDAKVGEEAVCFDSKDPAYKSPFGAVAVGEEVTFTIDTGDDVTQAKLVIKGGKTYDMVQPEAAAYELGKKQWTCTITMDRIGEYDYYFALSNGSDVKIYGDDDGYYGTGKVSDLSGVMPYDLVVHTADFTTPDWMKNAVIYQIFPDRFFDGDVNNNLAQTTARGDVDYEYISNWYTLPENPEQMELNPDAYPANAHKGDGEWSNEIYGGDLEGITQRIDYLKALGVNVIYLNPVFSSISSHRYDACDYMEIDPILGTLGDFQELVAVAEANDMHIILDGVFNHVSDDSVYFDRYYKFLGQSQKIGAYPYWAYVYDYMAENSADQAAAEAAAKAFFGENYGITDYTYTTWFDVNKTYMEAAVDEIGLRAGKPVYSYDGWWGYDSMPIIKSTNGSEYQTGSGSWAREIIDGSGSVTQYWISQGNNGWRLDVANEVSDETWQKFRASVKGLDSDAVIIGEIWDDATKYLKGDMYDSVMNYLFRNAVTGFAMGTKTSEQAANELERIRERYPEEAFYAMMNLVGSHDTTRILSYLDGIGDDRSDKTPAAAFPTYAATSVTAKARQHLVALLQFTYPGAPTIYYGDELGMVGSDDPDDRRAMEWGMGNQELVEWYARLAAIRKAYPALATGSIEMLPVEENSILAFAREENGQQVLVYANNSASTFTSDPGSEALVDLITGQTWTGTIPAHSGVILVAQEDAKEITLDSAALAPAYDPSYLVGERYFEETLTLAEGETSVTMKPNTNYYLRLDLGTMMMPAGTMTWTGDVTVTTNGVALQSPYDLASFNPRVGMVARVESEGTVTFTITLPEEKPNSQLALGDNAIDANYDGVVADFTAEEDGTYILSVAEGETNAYVMLEENTESIDLPYEFTMTAGETKGFLICTNEQGDDTIDLVLSKAPESFVTYEQVSVSLAGDIGLNYYVKVSQDIADDEGAYLTFTLDGQTQTIYLKDLTINSKGQYRFSAKLAAKDMACPVTAQMYTSAGAIGESKTYSVKDYCADAIPAYSADVAYESLVALLKAMVNYGAASQVSLNHNVDIPANAILAAADQVLPELPDVSAYAAKALGSEEGIVSRGASLLLKDTTTIRFYFQLTGTKAIEDYAFAVDGKEVTPVQVGSYYCVDVVGIEARNLDEFHNLTVGGLSVDYCGLSYIVSTLKLENVTETAMNMVKALWAYSQAAESYFK